MTEIRKTLAILKARWPEVTIIIGIHILFVRSNILFVKLMPESMRILYVNYFISYTSLLFLLIQTVLRCGFLRTVYLEGQKRQALVVLLRTGIYFLWRMFVLYVIYALLSMLSITVFSNLIPSDASFWFHTLYPILVSLVLIKLIVLIPALIIILDCRVFDSFRFIKRYKLSNAKELIFLYCGNIAIGLLGAILSRYFWGTSCGTTCCSVVTTPQYILTTVFSIITYFINLMTAVMAVRFVASHDLDDDHGTSLNPESLQGY